MGSASPETPHPKMQRIRQTQASARSCPHHLLGASPSTPSSFWAWGAHPPLLQQHRSPTGSWSSDSVSLPLPDPGEATQD